jgi:hypothetical protein
MLNPEWRICFHLIQILIQRFTEKMRTGYPYAEHFNWRVENK